MARPARPVPVLVLRSQALAHAIDCWSKVASDSSDASEYLEMAQYWYRSLDPFLNPQAQAAAEIPPATSTTNPKGAK